MIKISKHFQCNFQRHHLISPATNVTLQLNLIVNGGWGVFKSPASDN